MHIIASCNTNISASILHDYRRCGGCLHIGSRRSCPYSGTLAHCRRSSLQRRSSRLAICRALNFCVTKEVQDLAAITHCSKIVTCSADRACAPECKEALLSVICRDWRRCGCAVAYVKYDKASSAAAALESLHEAVLSDGRTKLKVMLAEAPNTRSAPGCAALQCVVSPPASRADCSRGQCEIIPQLCKSLLLPFHGNS